MDSPLSLAIPDLWALVNECLIRAGKAWGASAVWRVANQGGTYLAITAADVWEAYRSTLDAADRLGRAVDVKAGVRAMVAVEGAGERFVTKVLGRELEL